MAIAANKVHGIRATLAANAETVRLTRAHNDANVLAVGALFTESDQACSMVDLFLSTAFDGGRHLRRVDKISEIERSQGGEPS
jgi:ribose 5-phosphate isomerase B